MSQLSLSVNTAKSVASLINLTDQKNLPILGLIRCEISDGKLTAIATDKYSLAVATYGVDAPDAVFYFDADAAKFIAAIKPPKYGSASVEIEFDDETLVIHYDGQTISRWVKSVDYPTSIQSVITNWQAAETANTLAINMQRLASYSKLVGSDGKKIEKWEMKLGANVANPAKPAPLRFEAGAITVLSQPMML